MAQQLANNARNFGKSELIVPVLIPVLIAVLIAVILRVFLRTLMYAHTYYDICFNTFSHTRSDMCSRAWYLPSLLPPLVPFSHCSFPASTNPTITSTNPTTNPNSATFPLSPFFDRRSGYLHLLTQLSHLLTPTLPRFFTYLSSIVDQVICVC